jgi:hypothetical protein
VTEPKPLTREAITLAFDDVRSSEQELKNAKQETSFARNRECDAQNKYDRAMKNWKLLIAQMEKP